MTSTRTRPLVLFAPTETVDHLASAPLVHPFCFPAFPAVPAACEVIRFPVFRLRAQERKETPHPCDVYAFPNDIDTI